MKIFTPILTFPLLLIISCNSIERDPGRIIDSENTLFSSIEANDQWPSYRGYFASGYLNGAMLPDSFNIESGDNVQWDIPIPGMGLSCPVIWNNRIFITTAISEQDNEGFRTGIYGDIEPVVDSSIHTWKLFCINKKSGKINWERTMHEGIPAVKRHPKSTHANTTVATDGRHVIVFLGSEGLYCYDMKGNLVWKRYFGLIMAAWHIVESAEFEFCSSPVIFDEYVIIQADALNHAFVAVLNKNTGETIWRKERKEIPGWQTPNIYFEGDQPRVVVNGYLHRGAYDLFTGEEIWQMEGGGDVPIPTPVVWKDLLFFNSAHGRHAPLMALKNSAKGIIPYPDNDSLPGDDFAWFYDRGGSYMSSVLVYDSLLYRLRWNGNLLCLDARSGEIIYDKTVYPYSFIASPVAADGKLFLVSEEGTVYIVRTGREYELLAKSSLGEISLVTPGIAKDMIIFRTASRLMAIGNF